jgi:phosphate-selective porin
MKKKNSKFTIMHRQLHIFFAAVLFVTIIVACSKSGTTTVQDEGGGVHVYTPTDTIPPVVDIYTPAAAQTFSNGNSISITGKLTDDYGLYRGTIRITNDASGTLVKEQQYEIHGLLSYNFNFSHTVFTLAAADYTIAVSFEDHGTNVTTKTVKVKVNP